MNYLLSVAVAVIAGLIMTRLIRPLLTKRALARAGDIAPKPAEIKDRRDEWLKKKKW